MWYDFIIKFLLIMKNIFQIYFSDLKKIFSNRVAILIIVTICILPSLYARFYLKSSRDPYWNTKWLKVAVVNNDEWVMFDGSYINIWKDIVDELKQNDNIWWVFVDEDVAQEGTRLGHYYANIVIESWFSQKITTFLDENPVNPELHYTVNEKLNAIVPKITDQWTSAIKENIEKQFVRTVDEVVMSKLRDVWFTVKNDRADINRFVQIVHEINWEMWNLDKWLDSSISLANKTRNDLYRLNSKAPSIYESIDDGKQILSDTQQLSQDTINFLNSAPNKLRSDITAIESTMKKLDKQSDKVLSFAWSEKNEILSEIVVLTWYIWEIRWKIASSLSVLNDLKVKVQTLSSAGIVAASYLIDPIDNAITKYQALDQKLKKLDDKFTNISNQLNLWYDTLVKDKKEIRNEVRNLEDDVNSISRDLDRNIIPWLKNLLSEVYDISGKWTDKLDEIEDNLPDVQNWVISWIDILDTTVDKLQDLQKSLPAIQSSISKLDREFQNIKKSGIIDQFLWITSIDPSSFADFFTAPIEVVEHRLFSIPNYGSAMSPFFTVLAIWVWGLLMIAMFTTRIKDLKFVNCKDYEKFFWKWLFFATISIFQWLIVSLWELLILGVYVHSAWAFMLVTLLCSITFSMIAFACVSTFWNAWKAIMIILLVLQLSWSGGTFPIEMSDPFFQAINPYLPFTYAINAMREAVGGVVPQIFCTNLSVLLWFFGLFALIWLLIRPLISKKITLFDNKFSEIELLEH